YQKLFDADVLVVNIPPGRTSIAGIGNSDFYARQIANIAQLAAESKVKQILYISATSVYPDVNGIVREADILTLEATCSETMLLAEHAIKSSDAYQLSILRMGGL